MSTVAEFQGYTPGVLYGRIIDNGGQVVNAESFGINESGDNTDALNKAIASLRRGSFLLVPVGNFSFSGPIVGASGVSIMGALQGSSATINPGGNLGTRLIYTGSDAAGLSMASFQGWSLLNFELSYTNSNLTGYPLLDLSGPNCAFGNIINVSLVSATPATLQSVPELVNLSGTLQITFDTCRLMGGTHLVRGVTIGSANAYANSISFKNTFFSKYSSSAVVNPDKGWSYTGCAFEPNASGAGVSSMCESGFTSQGVTYLGCWGGDNTSSGAWIMFRGTGLSIIGGSWTLGSNIELVQLQEVCNGIFVAGAALRGTGGATIDLNGNTASKQITILSTPETGQAFKSNVYPASGLAQQGTGTFEFGNPGFYGSAPVAKAANPGTATGTDAAVINAIVTALRNLGLVT